MVYESSYESGRKPFLPDLTRGKWATPTDFIYASLALGFKIDVYLPLWTYFYDMKILSLVPYIFCLALYVVPIVIIQSFMGQFSSSGFISTFRISPLFKGMGYISLAVNLTILTYYSIFVAVPMVYLFNSFRPTMPWSCEALPELIANTSYENSPTTCNISFADNSTNATMPFYHQSYRIPSVLYFRSLFGESDAGIFQRHPFVLAWQLVVCSFLTWGIIALVFYKCFNTEKLGKLLRFSVWTVFVLLAICLVRFAFLPGALNGMVQFFEPNLAEATSSMRTIPIFVLSAFGPGWGSIITLASFNKFNTNIARYSWIICLGQMFAFTFFGFIVFFVRSYFSEITNGNFTQFIEFCWTLYLTSASAIATMELPNLWSIIFYTMLMLIGFIVMIPQFYSVLVSIFDDFEYLRSRKSEFTLSLVGLLAVLSTYFCTNEGMLNLAVLTLDSILTQTALNLLLLLVILWIYGRERFQRDFEFMVNRPFASWKVNMLRFVAPIILVLTLLFSLAIALFLHAFSSMMLLITALFLILLPWIFIPAYGIVCMLQTTGSLLMRFKRCARPTDWYPVDAEDRQRYEEAMGNMDITHQLTEVPME